MLTPKFHGSFRKDYKQAEKRGKDMGRLNEITDLLARELPLQPRHKNHPLHGDYQGWWECHIESDWLLIYRIDKPSRRIIFFRTGTHSDLFG